MAVALAACASPSGTPVESCGVEWHDVEPVVAAGGPGEASHAEPAPITCIRTIGERRIRIGFELPPGPDCHELAAVDIVETAGAVSVTLLVRPIDNPLAGACAPRPAPRTTEVDLQAPVAERTLLDGSR
jgi:hypothetical protein